MRRRRGGAPSALCPGSIFQAGRGCETNVPAARARPHEPRQHVRYVTAADGTRLAWAEAGAGPAVVKAANWLTHLEYEWESPVWRHWLQFFSGRSRFVRYDERGCGMSEWRRAAELSLDRWAADLEAVVEAARTDGAGHAARHLPGRGHLHPLRRPPSGTGRPADSLRRLRARRAAPRRRRTPGVYRAMIDLARVAWGRDNPTFRQVFTSRFIPGGTHEQLQWFNDLCLKTTTGEIAASLLEARGEIDVTADARPGARADARAARARRRSGPGLGRTPAGARHSRRRVRRARLAQPHPARARAGVAALPRGRAAFMRAGRGRRRVRRSPRCRARERQVLALMADGLSNTDIAERLQISDKTVRNHVSNVFDKLGVWSRAQAIVFARDHGFSG